MGRVLALWVELLLFGLALVAGRRRAWQIGIGLLVVALLMTLLISCGGGGTQLQSAAPTPSPQASSAVITVSGSAGGLQHSTAVTIAVN